MKPVTASLLLLLQFADPLVFVGAEEIRVGPDDDWFSLLHGSDLQPGDTVLLEEGTYSDPRRLVLEHRGTREAPITIRGEPGNRVLFQRPDAKQNTFNLEGAEFLSIEKIEITGGSAAIRISNPDGELVRNITLRGLHIHHIGGVAITCNHLGKIYEGMHFQGNEIHHTGGHGEAFYLGANNDADGNTVTVFRNSLIEENYLHHLNGPTVSQGDGIELKDGSYGNTIRNNVIHDTKFPAITVYGTDGNERNVIEHNVLWNTGDHGIQAASEALIRGNVVLDAKGDGIRSKSHQSARVGQLEILGNTIFQENGVGIRVDSLGESSGEVRIVDNVIAAGTAFRIPDDERVLLRDNEVREAPSDRERQSLRERALERWKSSANGRTPSPEADTE